MAKSKTAKGTVVIKGNNGVININNGRAAKSKTKSKPQIPPHREKAINKINDKKHLDAPEPACVKPKPKDMDTQNVVHLSNNCIANDLISAQWSQEPTIRFCRRTQDAQDGLLIGFTRYRDTIRFNDWTFRNLGLKIGMKLALFVDRRKNPRYLMIQNVVREYEAPAHTHRLGTYTLKSDVARDCVHLCKPETRTELGYIGHNRYEPHPMTLFSHFPHLTDHQMRLWRVQDEPDLIFGEFDRVTPVPQTLSEKLLRENVPLLTSDLRPYNPCSDRKRLMGLLPSRN